jgi:HEAT repeat protein
MSLKQTTEQKLARIAAQERDGDDAALTAWLADAAGLVVARAAEAIGRRGLEDAIPALIAAFTRLLHAARPGEVDKGCRAKEALIQALDALRNGDPEPYRQGMRHVQMEPVWGGRADTAVFLRAVCVTALARLHPAAVAFDLLPLLYDPAPGPRQAAVRAFAYLGGEQSELLLRGKILAGDDDPELLREAFAALLTIETTRGLPFVETYLSSEHPLLVEQAALALGASHLPEALPLLRARWEANTDLALRQSLLVALALTRTEEAFHLLLTLLPEGGSLALFACDALVPYAADPRARERIEAAIAKCRNAKLADRYTEHFPPAP